MEPNSLRACFGLDRVLNGVHCTDLPEDGQLEVQYVFSTLLGWLIISIFNSIFHNNLKKFELLMGNICPCPRRRQTKEYPYDVHEETFEI